MEKQIILKADKISIDKANINLLNTYFSNENTELKDLIIIFIIFSSITMSLLGIAYLFPNISNIANAIAIFFIFLSVINLISTINKGVKLSIQKRKFNNKYKIPTDHYRKTSFIYCTLFEDRMEYEGLINITIKWNNCKEIAEVGESFYLISKNNEAIVWIPKATMINQEDYTFLKSYIQNKINNEPQH